MRPLQGKNGAVTRYGRTLLTFLILASTVRLFPHFQRVYLVSVEAGGFESSDCTNIGVLQIQRIDVYDEIVFTSTTQGSAWKAGHFDFDLCDFANTSTASPEDRPKVDHGKLAVLTVLDANYIDDILPSWVNSVRKASAHCFVLTFDNALCGKVETFGCICMVLDEDVAQVSSSAKGWHHSRVASVKFRFLAAMTLLKRGYDVIMHDADAILSLNSIIMLSDKVMSVRASNPNIQLIVQDNGPRKANFDSVNWGFAWIRSSDRNFHTFSCLLQRWDDPAFGCLNMDGCNEYYLRSQPRINHILELSIASGMGPDLCLITDAHVKALGVHHMTGYNSALMKITCAKAQGALADLTRAESTLSYNVPKNSTPSGQRHALQVSLFLARRLHRKVQIPESYFDAKPVDFCLLFDLYQEPGLHSLLTTRLRGEDYGLPELKSLEELDTSTSKHILVDFHLLVDQALITEFHVPICNPHNPAYRGIHMCQRKHRSDEI